MADVRWMRLTVAVVVAVLPWAGHAAEEETPVALVEKLRDEDFDTRQQAMDKLAAMGEEARGILEKTLKENTDPQLKEVARQLLSKLETASLLVMAYDRDGKPAADAQADANLYRQDQSGKQESLPINIGANGTATVKGLSPGFVTCAIAWKKWLSLPESMLNPGALELKPGLNPFVVVLSAGGTLTATIKDKDGKPVKDASLTLHNSGQLDPDIADLQIQIAEMWGMRGGSTGSSDAEGKLKLENVGDGVYNAVIRVEGYKTGLAQNVRVFEGETTDLGEMVLLPRIRTKISMLLQKADNTPVKNGKVYVTLEPVFQGEDAEKRLKKLRRMQNEIDMRQQRNTIDTDETGKVSLENIEVGKYRVWVRLDNDAPQDLGEVEVKANGDAPADLGTLTFIKGGGIRGKIFGADGKPLMYVNLNAARQDLAEGGDPRFGRFQWRNAYVTSQPDGTYEMKNLAPGKYVVSAYTQKGSSILLLFGVEVESNKVAEAPEIKVPDKKETVAATAVKGTVLMPDGKPALGAQVLVYFGAGGTLQANANQKGEFNFQFAQDSAISRISVRSSKYKPVTLDMNDKAINPAELTIRLEKQDYAVLNVKVVDEAGVPLSDVGVGPRVRNRNMFYGAAAYRRIKTNEKGVARLTGLATGNRYLDIEKQGYYLNEAATAVVKPDVDNETTIVLKKGLVVKGKLALPAQTPTKNILVGINDPAVRSVPLGENAEFALEGVSPGKYRLQVMAPGLALPKPVEINVEEGKTVEPLNVPLVRRGGAVLNIGKELNGATASLVAADAWPPEPVGNIGSYRHGGNVDAAGNAVLWGDPPGKYRLAATAPLETTRSVYGTTDHSITVTTISEPIDVVELKTFRDLPKLAQQQVEIPTGSGRIVGRLAAERAPSEISGNQNQANLSVRVVGPMAQGVTNFSYPSEFMGGYNAVPVIIGTPPPGYKVHAAGQFTADGLPAGEYKVLLDATWHNYGNVRASVNVASADAKQQPQLLKTFTLKEGESLDLGELKFTPPLSVEEKVKPGFEIDLEDIVPVFQP